MKKIFVLLVILCSVLPAQQSKYVLEDYHHEDFYSGRGNWTRNIDKAMKLNYKAATDTLTKISKTPLGDPNDEYGDSAPIRIVRYSKSSKALSGEFDEGFVQELINEMLSEVDASKHGDNRRMKDYWNGYEKGLTDLLFRLGWGEIDWDKLRKDAKEAADKAYKNN